MLTEKQLERNRKGRIVSNKVRGEKKRKRQAELKQLLPLTLSIADMAKRLGVNPETIRRDLKEIGDTE